MCGEKRHPAVLVPVLVGSPPHVRGKVGNAALAVVAHRITPACAGKSGVSDGLAKVIRDHPRMCGEKYRLRYAIRVYPRITPACAGKSDRSTACAS